MANLNNGKHQQALLERIAQLEGVVAGQRRKSRSRSGFTRKVLATGAVFGVVFGAGIALSQATSDCAPASVVPFCFKSGEGASATQVNQNFKSLADSLSALTDSLSDKVSQDSAGNVEVSGSLGLGYRIKDCKPEVDAAADEGEYVVDCSCASDEVVINGGGSGLSGRQVVLRESRPLSTSTWRVSCRAIDADAMVKCGGMVITCGKIVPR